MLKLINNTKAEIKALFDLFENLERTQEQSKTKETYNFLQVQKNQLDLRIREIIREYNAQIAKLDDFLEINLEFYAQDYLIYVKEEILNRFELALDEVLDR